MPNFDNRQSATRKTPDPSSRAYAGVIAGGFTVDAETITVIPDRAFSLQRTPNVTAYDAGGAAIATALSATSDGMQVEITMDTDCTTATTIKFAERDGGIRGLLGEYMTPAALSAAVATAPTLMSFLWNDIDQTFRLEFDQDVTFNPDGSAFFAACCNGRQLKPDSVVSNSGGVVICTIVDFENTMYEGLTTSMNDLSGYIEGAFGGIPATPWTDLDVQSNNPLFLTFEADYGAGTLTLHFREAVNWAGFADYVSITDDSGTATVCNKTPNATPVSGDGTTAVSFASMADDLTTPLGKNHVGVGGGSFTLARTGLGQGNDWDLDPAYNP